MFIVNHRKLFIGISTLLVALAIFSMSYFGLNFGIDFKGGSLLEIEYSIVRPSMVEVENTIKSVGIGSSLIQPVGDFGYSIKARDITDAEKNSLLSALGVGVTEIGFNSVGPSVGAELVKKSILSFILVALGIILWVAYSFRKVSKPVSSWKYGITAVLALVHDVVITAGVFALLSHFMGKDIDTLFVVAILTVLGLSVSDTIVIFDRIRENVRNNQGKSFEENVGNSIKKIYPRSLLTSFTTILALVSLVVFGPESTKLFAITLTIGMVVGTYSSICLASPLLVIFKNLQKK
jgi:preprotein translocase subunit SecF